VKVTKQILLSMCLNCIEVYERPDSGCLFIVLNSVYYLIQATGDLYPYTEYHTDNRITDSAYLLMFINNSYSYLR
jgi:hypothetical protein